MSRLTHTLLTTAICLVCASSAFARQGQFDAPFPPTLRQALGQRGHGPSMVTPWKTGVQPKRPQRDTNDEKAIRRNNRPPMKQIKSVSTPNNGNATPRADSMSVRQENPDLASPGTRAGAIPTPTTAIPNAAKPINSFPRTQTPFPHRPASKVMPRSVVDLSRSRNLVQNFGTVMTFPAADDLTGNSTSQQPRVLNQNFNLAPGASSIEPRLASSPIRTTDQSNQELPLIVSRNSNNSEQSGINGMDQVATAQAQVIRTTVFGPEILIQDTPDLFEIEVTNNSSQTATNIIVQMGVSNNLTITDFDRQAWLDNKNRKVSWKLDSLPSGFKEVIRFRAVSGTPGGHEQNLTVGMENTFQGQTSFVTLVIENPDRNNIQRPAFEK